MKEAKAEKRRLHAIVQGRVQGVGFRMFVWERARALGLVGFVRNLPTREVEVVAEGPREALERLISALWRGPSGAQVKNVHVFWEKLEEKFNSFEIKVL